MSGDVFHPSHLHAAADYAPIRPFPALSERDLVHVKNEAFSRKIASLLLKWMFGKR